MSDRIPWSDVRASWGDDGSPDDVATFLMGEGKVDGGMLLLAAVAEADRLTALISCAAPVCPHCSEAMAAVHFQGYYDQFDHWQCGCSELPTTHKLKGGFA